MKDPYLTLGVPRDATDDMIKTAYRKLVLEWHPDRNSSPEATERFKEINAAYEAIKTPEKRDQHFEETTPRHTHKRQPFNDERGGFYEFGFNDGNIEDILRDFYRQTAQNRGMHSHDLMGTCNISLKDAYTGKIMTVPVRSSQGIKTVSVQIPPGVMDNARLRVTGAGERFNPSMPPGDVFVTVRVLNDPKFTRTGATISCKQTIDALDAILGGEVEIATVDGSSVRVVVPPGSQHGQRLRLSGKGMPVVGSRQRGDMIVLLEVVIPENIDKECRDLLEQVRTKMMVKR